MKRICLSRNQFCCYLLITSLVFVAAFIYSSARLGSFGHPRNFQYLLPFAAALAGMSLGCLHRWKIASFLVYLSLIGAFLYYGVRIHLPVVTTERNERAKFVVAATQKASCIAIQYPAMKQRQFEYFQSRYLPHKNVVMVPSSKHPENVPCSCYIYVGDATTIPQPVSSECILVSTADWWSALFFQVPRNIAVCKIYKDHDSAKCT